MRVLGALVAISASACVSAAAQTKGDVEFMTGMISHHAQAVVMAGWAPTHGASPDVRALCERIVVGQQDEITFMQRWLREHHEAPPGPMAGMDMDHAMLMPGMLTAQQLAQLDSARGPEFDRLFLTYMIQHHRGALVMVRALLDSPRAARDGVLFQFAADVSADQATEINRMSRMLLEPSSPLQRSPQ